MFFQHHWESNMDCNTIRNKISIYCFLFLLQTILNYCEIIQNVADFQSWFSLKTLQQFCSMLLVFHLIIQGLWLNELIMSHVHYGLFHVLGPRLFTAINYWDHFGMNFVTTLKWASWWIIWTNVKLFHSSGISFSRKSCRSILKTTLSSKLSEE